MREALVEGRLTSLYWCDTRDMVADGLTKGSVERDPIVLLYSKNQWKGFGDQPVSVSLVQENGGKRSVRREDGQDDSSSRLLPKDANSQFQDGGRPPARMREAAEGQFHVYLDWTTVRG